MDISFDCDILEIKRGAHMRPYWKDFLIVLLVSLIPSTQAEPIPDLFKKDVTFIFLPGKNGDLTPNGTAFFIGVAQDSPTNAHHATYLITAKHVISAPDRSVFPYIILRLNLKQGGSTNALLPLITHGPAKNVFFHQDPTVDIAVINIALMMSPIQDIAAFDIEGLDSIFVTTKKDFADLKISEGTEIFFVGLFHQYFGSARNYPIVRFGKVALITEEQIEWPELIVDSGTNLIVHTKQDLYLMESTSTGGNSGSPVFFSFSEPGTPKQKLAGVMKGFFGEIEPIFPIETAISPAARGNSGIAAVVPAYKLHEILFDKEMIDSRGF